MRRPPILDKIPLLFLTVPPLLGAGAFFVAGTGYLDALKIFGYLAFLLSAGLVAWRHFGLMHRSEGMASVWLVTFAYYKLAFTVTLAAILGLVAARIAFGDSILLDQIAYTFIIGSATASVIAATIMELCWRKDCLDHHVPYRLFERRKGKRDLR